MIAPEYFNNHIAVEGEIIVKSVPNDAGSVMVWNPTTKKISQRTKAEIIADLDIMTLSTSQYVRGQKSFMSSGISDEHANNLWVRSEDGSEPGITFWKTGFISSTLTLRNDGFHFGVGANNHYDYVKAEGFRKNGSSDNFFLTGGGNDYDSRKKEDSWVHSGRNFQQGTFIETDIDYSVTYGDQFLLEMKGNMYSNGQYLPLDSKIQGYIYDDTIISEGGYSTLNYFNYVICLNFNGKLAIWFPGMGYWQGFDAKITVGYGGLDQGRNRVTSITDSGDPGGTKRVKINLKHLLTKEELISGNTFWEKKDTGGYWVLDSDRPIAGLNGNSSQVILSGGLLASSAYTDSQFIPPHGIHSRGFVQTDEGFQNRFYKVDERNRIWSFANADTYGLSYYQGSANNLGEGIGFHFGDADNPTHFLGRSGQIYSKVGIYSGSFTTGNNQVLNYSGPSTLYIGNPTINTIIESNGNDIIHYKNGVNGVVWDAHNLDPSTFVNASALNNYVPYNGAAQDVNLGAKDLEFEGGGSINKHQNKVRIFNKVYHGYYDDGGHTGILAIKMPQASPDHAMFSIDINIYGYESQYLGKVNVAFYKYVSGTIVPNGSKAIWEVTDNFPTTTARVGIGTDGYVSILLGEANTFWNAYLSFEVAKVEVKYGNYNQDWNVGWSHAIEPNFDLYPANIIVLPSDVVATRSWLTNFADSSYIPKAVQLNDNFNSLGGYSNSGVYRANNNSGGVQHLYSPMLHMGAQDTTAQLQVKYNDTSADAGELVYRSGYNGNWTLWRRAWDNVNFKPSDYQTRNTDEIISAAKSYYNRIPFKLKNSSYKSWSIQKPTTNNLIFAPSVTKNAEDWDLGNGVEFTDAGQVSSKGFNKIGYNDNYLLTAGGGHRLATDFVSSSNLGNYVTLDTPQNIGAKKNFTQGLTVNTNYGGLPILGQMNNIPTKVSSIDETYGMGMGIVDSGQGYIQQQRFDGTAHAYDLLLQPSGGNVVVGYSQKDYHNDKLETIGKIVSKGNEMNSVKTYVSVFTVDEIVAGHTLNWYNTSWKVGNRRGGSDNSIGYSFDLSTDGGGTYQEKVRIHTDGNIATQNFGNAQQWYQAHQWGDHANGGYLKGLENAQTLGFSSGLSAGAPYIYHRTDGYVFLATQSWVSSNFTNQTLSIQPEEEGGQWINLTNSNGVFATNYFVTSRDGSRNPDTVVTPNGNSRRVRFDFINAGSVGGSGNYAGVMTYAPWDGTSASTGDSSYQLAFANQTGINGDGIPMLKIRKGIDDKWSKAWYKLWSDADFSQGHINNWNFMSSNGIIVNQQFTNNTGNALMVVDEYHGGDSGIYNENDEFYLTALQGEYYKYSSRYNGWEGINFNRKNYNIGIGTAANDADKVTVSGSVKATENFKSKDEKPNTLFIPDGSLSYLDDEITNEKSRMRLSHGMIEQQPGTQYYDSDNRMLVIRCVYGEHFVLGKCFRGQRILVLNASDNWQGFDIESAGYSYKIPPYSSIQLFVWDEKTVYKYAENKMY